jgi:hypothetical protein
MDVEVIHHQVNGLGGWALRAHVGVQRNRFLIQTNHGLGRVVGFLVDRQVLDDAFHLAGELDGGTVRSGRGEMASGFLALARPRCFGCMRRPAPLCTSFFSRHGFKSWLCSKIRMVSRPTFGTSLRLTLVLRSSGPSNAPGPPAGYCTPWL